jgi:hypothetical protein
MADTRKYAKALQGWKTNFNPGQGQLNQRNSFLLQLRQGWRWEAHFTVNEMKERAVDKFTKEHAVTAFHLTMEYKEGDQVVERPAMHWKYDSATDQYKCLGWKAYNKAPTHGVVYDPTTHELTPGLHNPDLYSIAELPQFDPSPETRQAEQNQIEARQRAAILQMIDAKVDATVKRWFGGQGVEGAKWQMF